ncbi:MAG: hypothetical protein K2I92_02000 [Muribaculaceae bacterium]|nr:hypothetical protein [Muribaculaceae bacterium]
MQVVTLSPEEFDRHAAQLAHEVEAASVHFDAIIGVRRGGSIVCDAFLRHFPQSRYGARYDVTLQRPSTKRKQGRFARLLKLLPYPLLDRMRMAESIILSARRRMQGAPPTADVDIPEALCVTLKDKTAPEILIIDDAIDSGDTLTAITNTLKKRNPATRICIAVVTETTRHPSIRADYTLYRNRTLIRFPWSNDYKNP